MKNSAGVGVLRDFQIREVLTEELVREHASSPDTLVLEEFGCKEARADLAVVNGVLHCYEIKSGRDSLTRLKNQIPAYSAVFDNVTLVLEKNHLAKAREVIPSWWGIMLASIEGSSVRLRSIRTSRDNKRLDGLALSRMLWKDEALRLLRANGLSPQLSKAPVNEIWQAIADSLPVEVISAAVRAAIKARGGSGFRQSLMRSDDSFPKRSSSPHCQVPLAD